MRRALKLLLPWIVLCAVFWKPLLGSGMGMGAKAFFRISRGWNLDYRSVAWQEKGLVFSDLILKESGRFQLKADEAILSFSKKHLEIERPRIVLRELPSLKAPTFAWTFAVRNGTLKGDGIEKARFEAERKVLAQGVRFELGWEECSLAGELLEEQGIWKCDLLLKEFNPHVLRKWLGGEVTGAFNGRAYLVWEGETWSRGMGKLVGKDVAWKELAEGVFGSIDWEGPFAWEPFLQRGRARIALEGGKIFGWSDLSGEGNFVGGMGTKWEFAGIGEAFPVHWQGRGFFQSLKEHWVDSELSCGDALFSLQGRKKEAWGWEGKCEQVEAKALGFVQEFLTLLDPSVSEFALLDGRFNLQWNATGPIHQLAHWELVSFAGENLKGEGKNWTLAVEKGSYVPSGEFSFEKGSFEPGSVWSGRGKIEEGKVVESQFEGKWEEFLLHAKAQGSKEEFSVDMRGEGPLMGEGALIGGWDGEKIHFIVEKGEIAGLHFSGNGWIDFDWNFTSQIDSFYGPISTLWKLRKEENVFDGMIEGIGNGFTVQKGKTGWDWALQAKIEEGNGPLSSYARVEGVDFELGADPNGFQCINMKGNFICGQEIAFHCPIIERRGKFDVRLLGETWDFLRLAGTSTETGLIFDLKKSHLLGAPFQSATSSFKNAEFQIALPWKSCLAASSYFSLPKHWISLPLQGELALAFCYDKKEGAQVKVHGENLLWKQEPLSFDLYAFEQGKKWILDHLQVGDFSFAAEILPLLQVVKGQGTCEESLEFAVEGKVAGNQMELKVPSMKVDLGLISTIAEQLEIPFQKIEGVLEGTGHIHWKEKFESDFDFAASQLRIGSMIAENQGPLHVYYSSDRGALFRGLDLQIHNPDLDLPAFGWKIDLLQYGNNSFWGVERSHLHVPKECLETLTTTLPFLEVLQPTHDIDLIADLNCNSDGSFLDGSFREGFLPVGGVLCRVQDVHFLWSENRCAGDFSYFHQGHLLKVGFQVDTDAFKGRLTLEDGEKPPDERPLTLDWSRENGTFLLHSVEGSFAGIEALFHAEAPHSLIGSARIDFAELSEWIPVRIAQVFHDLKMGKGYEIKGRLNPREMVFRGLLSGKQLELLGYQLRTLLGQLELTPQRVHISDLKVSDSAGILKIEELIAETKGVEPWTISMPRLTITELRPCLLQKVGREELGPPTPLVVRELKLNDFRGFLEDSRTYTASGELFFINSYRRDHTVFDLPSDVLSRIVGLDLEILIPVCGKITYELKDRLFRLVDLKDSYSAGERTKFSLVKEGLSPTMDLDGNLQILVKMKQFVLFKFTESFLISIDGKLDEPKFHLQKKRRFLGL